MAGAASVIGSFSPRKDKDKDFSPPVRLSSAKVVPGGRKSRKSSIFFREEKKPTREFPLLEPTPSGIRQTKSNVVKTSRYTPLTFVPLNLFEQFYHAPINLFFLLMVFLQLDKKISSHGIPTVLLPLFTVLLIGAIKDGLEDYRRHQSDKSENNMETCVVTQNSEVKKILWADVKLGDTLLLHSGDLIPADVVIMDTSDEHALAYVQTANLDGETNLKVRVTPSKLTTVFPRNASDGGESVAIRWYLMSGTMKTEQPNGSLYTFEGIIDMTHENRAITTPLDEANTLLRGCKLSNTDWLVGKVIFTGTETKIQMNSTAKVAKKTSKMHKMVTKILALVLAVFIVLVCLSAATNVLYASSAAAARARYLYLSGPHSEERSDFVQFLYKTGSFLLIYMNLIPISLMVTMAIVKFLQALFINYDQQMIWKDNPAMPRTSDLMEELGQVEYVFSDKTGTLTQNHMEFRKCSIGGKLYGQGLTEIRRQVVKRKMEKVPPEPIPDPSDKVTPHVNFVDPEMAKDMKNPDKQRLIYDFFLQLAINHTAIPEMKENKRLYSASSPDEGALVFAAQHFGFEFMGRSPTKILVKTPSEAELSVTLLAIFEFTSDRKRSSLLCKFKDPLDETRDICKLYTKGADTVIHAILKSEEKYSASVKISTEHMEQMAVDGLRTLMLAERTVSEEELNSWLPEYEAAQNSMEDNREKMIADLVARLEVDLSLSGVTGLEDRLQGGVSETIESMHEAGINVWMLTGDKVETAINIGIATGLLEAFVEPERRPIFDWSAMAPDDLKEAQAATKQAAQIRCIRRMFDDCLKDVRANAYCFEAIVIDGQCLTVLLESPSEFLELSRNCNAVLCCRVSPSQKGEVVRLFKHKAKKVTLAIGDGANDCNMISSAHIGIGLRGEEGLQAFNSSDIGIGQFLFLRNLLLVHGRLAYRRIAVVILYMFYKNIVVVIPQFLWIFFSRASGQNMYEDMMYQFYNIFYSGLPIMIFGVLDLDTTRNISLLKPILYRLGTSNYYLNWKIVIKNIAFSLFCGMVIFFVPYFGITATINTPDGKTQDFWFLGSTVFTLVVIVVNIRLFLQTCFFTWITWLGYLLSFACLILSLIVYNFIRFNLYGSGHGYLSRAYRTPMMVPVIITTILICFSHEYMSGVLYSRYKPNLLQKIRLNKSTAEEEENKRSPPGRSSFASSPRSMSTSSRTASPTEAMRAIEEGRIPGTPLNTHDGGWYRGESQQRSWYSYTEADPVFVSIIAQRMSTRNTTGFIRGQLPGLSEKNGGASPNAANALKQSSSFPSSSARRVRPERITSPEVHFHASSSYSSSVPLQKKNSIGVYDDIFLDTPPGSPWVRERIGTEQQQGDSHTRMPSAGRRNDRFSSKEENDPHLVARLRRRARNKEGKTTAGGFPSAASASSSSHTDVERNGKNNTRKQRREGNRDGRGSADKIRHAAAGGLGEQDAKSSSDSSIFPRQEEQDDEKDSDVASRLDLDMLSAKPPRSRHSGPSLGSSDREAPLLHRGLYPDQSRQKKVDVDPRDTPQWGSSCSDIEGTPRIQPGGKRERRSRLRDSSSSESDGSSIRRPSAFMAYPRNSVSVSGFSDFIAPMDRRVVLYGESDSSNTAGSSSIIHPPASAPKKAVQSYQWYSDENDHRRHLHFSKQVDRKLRSLLNQQKGYDHHVATLLDRANVESRGYLMGTGTKKEEYELTERHAAHEDHAALEDRHLSPRTPVYAKFPRGVFPASRAEDRHQEHEHTHHQYGDTQHRLCDAPPRERATSLIDRQHDNDDVMKEVDLSHYEEDMISRSVVPPWKESSAWVRRGKRAVDAHASGARACGAQSPWKPQHASTAVHLGAKDALPKHPLGEDRRAEQGNKREGEGRRPHYQFPSSRAEAGTGNEHKREDPREPFSPRSRGKGDFSADRRAHLPYSEGGKGDGRISPPSPSRLVEEPLPSASSYVGICPPPPRLNQEGRSGRTVGATLDNTPVISRRHLGQDLSSTSPYAGGCPSTPRLSPAGRDNLTPPTAHLERGARGHGQRTLSPCGMSRYAGQELMMTSSPLSYLGRVPQEDDLPAILRSTGRDLASLTCLYSTGQYHPHVWSSPIHANAANGYGHRLSPTHHSSGSRGPSPSCGRPRDGESACPYTHFQPVTGGHLSNPTFQCSSTGHGTSVLPPWSPPCPGNHGGDTRAPCGNRGFHSPVAGPVHPYSFCPSLRQKMDDSLRHPFSASPLIHCRSRSVDARVRSPPSFPSPMRTQGPGSPTRPIMMSPDHLRGGGSPAKRDRRNAADTSPATRNECGGYQGGPRTADMPQAVVRGQKEKVKSLDDSPTPRGRVKSSNSRTEIWDGADANQHHSRSDGRTVPSLPSPQRASAAALRPSPHMGNPHVSTWPRSKSESPRRVRYEEHRSPSNSFGDIITPIGPSRGRIRTEKREERDANTTSPPIRHVHQKAVVDLPNTSALIPRAGALSYEHQHHMFCSSPSSSPTPFSQVPGFSQVYDPHIHNNKHTKEAEENYNFSSIPTYFPFVPSNHKLLDTSSTLRSRSLSPYYHSRPHTIRSVSPVLPQLHATASGSSISTNECTCVGYLKARNNALSACDGTREKQYFDINEDTRDGATGTTKYDGTTATPVCARHPWICHMLTPIDAQREPLIRIRAPFGAHSCSPRMRPPEIARRMFPTRPITPSALS